MTNSELTERSVSEPVSLKDLYGLLLNAEAVLDSSDDGLPRLVRDEPTASQYPATGEEERNY